MFLWSPDLVTWLSLLIPLLCLSTLLCAWRFLGWMFKCCGNLFLLKVLTTLGLSHYTRTWFHFLSTVYLGPCSTLLSYKSTLGWWSLQLLATSIHSQALGLRGLCSQLGTAGGDTVPNPGIVFETWPYNWVVLLVTTFLVKTLCCAPLWVIHTEEWWLLLEGHLE